MSATASRPARCPSASTVRRLRLSLNPDPVAFASALGAAVRPALLVTAEDIDGWELGLCRPPTATWSAFGDLAERLGGAHPHVERSLTWI